MDVALTEILRSVGYLLVSAGVAALLMRMGAFFEE